MNHRIGYESRRTRSHLLHLLLALRVDRDGEESAEDVCIFRREIEWVDLPRLEGVRPRRSMKASSLDGRRREDRRREERSGEARRGGFELSLPLRRRRSSNQGRRVSGVKDARGFGAGLAWRKREVVGLVDGVWRAQRGRDERLLAVAVGGGEEGGRVLFVFGEVVLDEVVVFLFAATVDASRGGAVARARAAAEERSLRTLSGPHRPHRGGGAGRGRRGVRRVSLTSSWRSRDVGG